MKIPHDKIVVTGDSAGAALLLEAMLQTYAPELLPANAASTADAEIETVTSSGGDKELPAAMLLVSPVVCAETTTPSWKENAKYDMIRPKLFKKVFKEFFGTKDPSFKDVRLIAMTKMQNGFEQFVPKNTMMVVGSKEVMRDDITEMSLRVVKNTNIKGHLVSEDYAHDWYVIRDTVKDKTAIQRTDAIFAEFVASALKEAQTPNPFDDRLAVDENAPKTVNNDLPVKFTRNGVTMRFSRNSMQELLGNLDQVDTSKEGIAKTLDSMAKMTAGVSTSNSNQNPQQNTMSPPQVITV
jgi:alpha/beta hydrolase fold